MRSGFPLSIDWPSGAGLVSTVRFSATVVSPSISFLPQSGNQRTTRLRSGGFCLSLLQGPNALPSGTAAPLGTKGHPGYLTRHLVKWAFYPKSVMIPVNSLFEAIEQDEC